MTSAIRLALFAAIVTGSAALGGCASVKIEPTGATVAASVVLEDVEDFHIAQVPGGSFAVIRADEESHGHVVESFDSNLGVTWRHQIPYERDREILPRWLVGSADGITLVYNRYENEDSISVHGMILDARSGAVRTQRNIAGVNLAGDFSEYRGNRIAASPDSTHFVIYRYDYRKLANRGDKKLVLVAELFDTKLNSLGTSTLDIPVGDDVDDAEDAEPYVQTFFVANDGHGYQVSYHGKATLRVSQIDFRTGTTRKLEQEIPNVDFSDEDTQLYGTREWTGDGEQVIVAASRIDDEVLTGLMLAGMNFKRNNIDFVNLVEITETLANKLVEDDELAWFKLRDILRMPDGEIVVPLEQVEVVVVTHRDRQTGITSYSHTNYFYRDVVMMGFNPKGESIWFAAQDRARYVGRHGNHKSDAWRVAGDSIHYIYRDEKSDAIVAGSISTKTGVMTFPKSLIETAMDPLNLHTKWLAPNHALMVLWSEGDYRLVRFSY